MFLAQSKILMFSPHVISSGESTHAFSSVKTLPTLSIKILIEYVLASIKARLIF